MSESVYPNPANSYSPEYNSYHRKKESVYQDESRNQYGLVGESVCEIDETYHDKETHED